MSREAILNRLSVFLKLEIMGVQIFKPDTVAKFIYTVGASVSTLPDSRATLRYFDTVNVGFHQRTRSVNLLGCRQHR